MVFNFQWKCCCGSSRVGISSSSPPCDGASRFSSPSLLCYSDLEFVKVSHPEGPCLKYYLPNFCRLSRLVEIFLQNLIICKMCHFKSSFILDFPCLFQSTPTSFFYALCSLIFSFHICQLPAWFCILGESFVCPVIFFSSMFILCIYNNLFW